MFSFAFVGFLSLSLYIGNSNAFTQSTPIRHNPFQCSKSTKQGPKKTMNRSHSSYSYQRNISMLFMQDLDSAEGYREGAELAKELFEIVRIRQFRSRLEEQHQRAEVQESREQIKAEEEKEEERLKRTLKSKRFPNLKEIQFGLDIQKSAKGNSKPNLFTLGPVFNTSRGNKIEEGGVSSTVYADTMNSGFNEMETSESAVLAQAGFVLILLIFYLYVGLTDLVTDAGKDVVSVMNTVYDCNSLENGSMCPTEVENVRLWSLLNF